MTPSLPRREQREMRSLPDSSILPSAQAAEGVFIRKTK